MFAAGFSLTFIKAAMHSVLYPYFPCICLLNIMFRMGLSNCLSEGG